MARSPHSLSGAHVLAWSSPLLLLVLLFTVTAHPTPSVPPATTPPTTTTSTSATTTTSLITTSSVPPKSTTTTAPSARPSVAETALSARSPARARAGSAASGALAGTLSPGFAVAVVPLRGPGAWSLTGSASISAVLYCPSVSGPVVGEVVITSAEGCQLQVTSTNAQGLPQWQLTPVH